MLAMTGITFLLLFVTFAIIHTVGLYTRGIAIRQINQVGRQVTQDISQAIRYGGDVTVMSDRLCSGAYSYIPNGIFQDSSESFGLVKISDTAKAYCDESDPMPNKSDSQILIDGGVAQVLEMDVIPWGVSEPMYEVKIVISTAGDNRAEKDSDTGEYYCDPQNGKYCAFGTFETTVYARKNNE